MSKGCFEKVNLLKNKSSYLPVKRGIKVPEEIVIIGFSNKPFSEVVTSSISTMKQPGFTMGQKAAQLIIHQILHDKEIRHIKQL